MLEKDIFAEVCSSKKCRDQSIYVEEVTPFCLELNVECQRNTLKKKQWAFYFTPNDITLLVNRLNAEAAK